MQIDYGGWLTEDLRELYEELIRERDRLENYSDRQQSNTIATQILAELQKRNKNE